MESVSLVLQGGLEYWNAEYWILEYLRSVYVLGLFFCALIYIPRPFYTYFCLDGTMRRRGVVHRLFSLCMVAFTKYGFMPLAILVFPTAGRYCIECYFDQIKTTSM
jgi:hypothetical protein